MDGIKVKDFLENKAAIISHLDCLRALGYSLSVASEDMVDPNISMLGLMVMAQVDKCFELMGENK